MDTPVFESFCGTLPERERSEFQEFTLFLGEDQIDRFASIDWLFRQQASSVLGLKVGKRRSNAALMGHLLKRINADISSVFPEQVAPENVASGDFRNGIPHGTDEEMFTRAVEELKAIVATGSFPDADLNEFETHTVYLTPELYQMYAGAAYQINHQLESDSSIPSVADSGTANRFLTDRKRTLTLDTRPDITIGEALLSITALYAITGAVDNISEQMDKAITKYGDDFHHE